MDRFHRFILGILSELGIPFDIETQDGRCCIQKAVYLVQAAGKDIGYRFRWYRRGPYSSELADAYFEFSRKEIESTPVAVHDGIPIVKEIIARCPEGVHLDQWLEAVASLDYLKRVRRLSESDARDAFQQECQLLEPLYEQASTAAIGMPPVGGQEL